MAAHDERETARTSTASSERRRALQALASSIRTLCDATVSTKIDPTELDEITTAIDRLRERLEAATHEGPYSGLMGRELDLSDPHRLLPLSPIIGPFNPVAPDVELRFDQERVRGTAKLGKKHVGPPNCAHGGIGAMIADQLVALAGAAGGVRGVTKSLALRFRRPIPLYEPLDLEGWCVEHGEGSARVAAEIRARGKVSLEIEGEIVESARLPGATGDPPGAIK